MNENRSLDVPTPALDPTDVVPRWPILSEIGEVYVSVEAVKEYQDFSLLGFHDARRELAAMLNEATPVKKDFGDGNERWRYGRKTADVIVMAIVDREDGRVLVQHIEARTRKRVR